MSNLLSDGMTWLEGQLKEHCSSSVEYRRDEESINLDAVLGKTDYQILDESGFETGAFIWDFIVTATDLGFEPQVGDLIIHNDRQFEVMRLPGQDCWRWTGITQSVYRIHSKEIGSDV